MSQHGRRCLPAALCGVAALLCSFAFAPAAHAATPSLDGSFLGAESGNAFTPGTITTTTLDCNTLTGEGRVHFRAEGVVINESAGRTTAYPGTYVEEGEFVISSAPYSPGSVLRKLSAWTSSFTITSGDKRVTGSRTLRPGAFTQGHCGPVSVGSVSHGTYIIGFAHTQYTAEIRTADGALLRRDAGISESEVQDIRNPAGNLLHRDHDHVSQDADGDGIAEGSDNCPATSNRDQTNTDGDTEGDACDADDDNDTVADGDDAFPLDEDESVDTDGDGTGNNADGDDDGDSHADGDDAFPLDENEWVDTDGDETGDNADSDDDNDSHADGADEFPLDKTEWADNDADNIGDNADSDDDNDTVADGTDNCALQANGDQADLDDDGKGDVCDADKDGDAVENTVDNCAEVANDQLDSDVDGRGDACDADDDNDGAADVDDNCPTVASESQRDSDGDGKGDACDATFDSTDGLTAGGGWITNAAGAKVHISYSALSKSGRVAGIGELREATKRVRLVGADGYSQADRRSVVVGDALVDGAMVRFRLETVDAGEPGRDHDTFELEAGDQRWAGTLAGGNLEVSR